VAARPRAKSCTERRCPFTWVSKELLDGYVTTAPVDAYPDGKTPLGILGLAGNVWEWTTTVEHGSSYQATPEPSNICRGNAWSTRLQLDFRAVGFRCVREVQGARN
jgi:formylglycine-generating enzyme required for sulfatase activity